MAQAPWWGVPVVAGAFLLIGGLLAFLYSSIIEKRKVSRENTIQYRTRLLESVVDFMTARQTMFERRPMKGYSDQENDRRIVDVDEQLHRMLRASQIMQLLSPDPSVSSKAIAAASAMDEYCNPTTTLAIERDYREISELRRHAFGTFDDFQGAAREALGVAAPAECGADTSSK